MPATRLNILILLLINLGSLFKFPTCLFCSFFEVCHCLAFIEHAREFFECLKFNLIFCIFHKLCLWILCEMLEFSSVRCKFDSFFLRKSLKPNVRM
jgi:hypothetical protein